MSGHATEQRRFRFGDVAPGFENRYQIRMYTGPQTMCTPNGAVGLFFEAG